jgi:dynein heavy chain
VASSLKEEIFKFKEDMWLIELLTIEAMIKKPIYFREVFKECQLPAMEPNDELTFESIKGAGLGNYRE